MRKIVRVSLPARASTYLARKQAEANAGGDPERKWKSARQTKTVRDLVLRALLQMAGVRARCMYCEDSRGADIEHFWPKVTYVQRIFDWLNMLLICTPCNRQKNDRFVLDAAGQPLLIDPTTDNPWDFLFYDFHTGIVTARYDPATGLPRPKGEHTTDPRTLPINIQAVTEGRLRTQRNLCRAVHGFIAAAEGGNDEAAARAELLKAVHDNDGFGLVQWFFLRDGSSEPPFRDLQLGNPIAWQAVIDSL